MLASGKTRFLGLIGGSVLPATLAALCFAAPAPAQETTDQPVPNPVPESDLTDPNTDPNNVPTVVPWTGLLSLAGGQRLLTEAEAAIAAQNYPLAQQRLQQARQIFNQLSNYHQQISSSYSGIDIQVSQEQRRKALESAELRDQATYQLALVHRAQNQPSLAVPLLVQILRSQNPTRPLGEQASGQLRELGLLGAAAPSGDASDPMATNPDDSGITVSNANSGLLSLPGGQRLLSDAEAAIARQDYAGAQERLQQARQVFNQLSNFHQQISASYAGIDNEITQDQRRKALEAAQLRDRSTYQLALVHRAQNQPELAVPLLVQMVTSQGPTRDLGEQASQQLRELGFIGSSLTPRPVVGGDREAAANPTDP